MHRISAQMIINVKINIGLRSKIYSVFGGFTINLSVLKKKLGRSIYLSVRF